MHFFSFCYDSEANLVLCLVVEVSLYISCSLLKGSGIGEPLLENSYLQIKIVFC